MTVSFGFIVFNHNHNLQYINRASSFDACQFLQ